MAPVSLCLTNQNVPRLPECPLPLPGLPVFVVAAGERRGLHRRLQVVNRLSAGDATKSAGQV
jgi:hypothetical protein